jgi:hypothetical protein
MSKTTTKPNKIPKNKRYVSDVMKSVDENYVWINAVNCIRPTDEFLIGIGRTVVNYLRESSDRTILQNTEGTVMEDLKHRELIVRFVKS